MAPSGLRWRMTTSIDFGLLRKTNRNRFREVRKEESERAGLERRSTRQQLSGTARPKIAMLAPITDGNGPLTGEVMTISSIRWKRATAKTLPPLELKSQVIKQPPKLRRALSARRQRMHSKPTGPAGQCTF